MVDDPSLLGLLSNGLSVALGIVSNAAYIKGRFKKKDLFKVKDIEPSQIMGDRGLVENGFRSDLYYKPLIRDSVIDAVNNDNINHIVITGRFASGKSRAVYEYLKSEKCPYSNVFIVPTSEKVSFESLCSQIEKVDPEDTIIVIDDINNIFDKDADDLGLGKFLGFLSNRSFKVLITLSTGEALFKKFRKNCRKGCDTYRGSRSSSVIKIIEIPKIEKDSKCYRWCRTNFKAGSYSTVIGGYISTLNRSIEKNLFTLETYKTALNLLISYYVGVKYRHNEGAKGSHIREMYSLRYGEINDVDFDDAIETLKTLGFIAEDYDSDKGKRYKINDMMIYESFVSQCGRGLLGQDAYEKMANTIEVERKQCDWLLDTREEKSILYSRILYHSKLKETKEYVKNKLNEILNDDKNYSQEFLQPYLESPIPALIEIFGESEYYEVRNMIDVRGIVPTIEIASALIRIAPRTLIKDEIVNYAQDLVKKYGLQQTIYYYRCIEQLDPEYDVQRVEIVKNLLNENPNGFFIQTDYQRYCTDLLCKAIDTVKSEYFWNSIAPKGLSLNKKSIHLYCEIVKKKTRNQQTETLLLNVFKKTIGYELDINRFSLANILLDACPSFDICYKLYDDVVESLSEDDIANSAITMDEVRCILIFPLLDKLSYKREEDVEKAHTIVTEILTSGGEHDNVWFSSRRKILNKYLSRMGSYDSMYSELEFFTDKNLKDFVSDDTIATALSVINTTIDNNREYSGVLQDVQKTVDLKTKYGKVTDPSYYTSLYTLARRMLENQANKSDIIKVLEYAGESKEENNEIIRAARLGCILEEEDVKNEINAQKEEIEEKHYINPDMISNLMLSINARFSESTDIRKAMTELIERYTSHVNIPNHSLFRQMLSYELAIRNFESEDLIKEINLLNDSLLAAQIPLIEDGNDLFRVCIISPHIDVWKALDLMYAVDRQSLEDSRKSDLWRVKLLKKYVEKLTKDKSLTSEEIYKIVTEDLQQMIDRHTDVDYSTEINNIVNDLKYLKRYYKIESVRKKEKPFALNFPISSIDPKMRHSAWMHYVNTQTLDSLHESSLKWFIIREEIGLKKPNTDRTYLKMAINEYRSRDPERANLSDNEILDLIHQRPQKIEGIYN